MQIGTEAPRPSGLQLLEDKDFVWSRVWPLVSSGESAPPGATFSVTVHRLREDGRAVTEYSFEDGTRVFAKVYPDDAAGRAVYRIHDDLCRNGFGPDSLYRVPMPIGYIDTHAVVLLTPATGECLGALEVRDWQAFEEGVAHAAQWLAALHRSRVTVGAHEDATHGMNRLARRAEKACASCPELESVLRSALAELERRSGITENRSPLVQTHGRFHAGHVFVEPASVTAFDLDRAGLADPAKDVGEFLHGLRSIAARKTTEEEAVEALCRGFLDEYMRDAPGVPSELPYYWSYCVVWGLVRLAFSGRPSRRHWAERIEFLKAELDAVPRRAAAWL
jgi:hypothetical protein